MGMPRVIFPFLRWFPITGASLRADFVAGITVALVLVPQSMAYAQLAGLPVVYGLYASFVPVIVASLWGSSNQLHTGPVAMLSLMSAAALMTFATPGTAEFIQLAIMLALMVGVLRLMLGVFKLGAIVNLLSSPVIVGFTNAAALIIGLSQLSKIIGVPFPRSDLYLADLWNVLMQIPEVHWWTLAFSIGAWLLIDGLRRISSAIPSVLIAVVIATLISAITDYENRISVGLDKIKDESFVLSLQQYRDNREHAALLTTQIAEGNREASRLIEMGDLESVRQAKATEARVSVYQHELEGIKAVNNRQQIDLHKATFHQIETRAGLQLVPVSQMNDTVANDGEHWRFSGFDGEQAMFSAGGAVVGAIPEGLPSFAPPVIRWDLLLALLPTALVMALIGFMEATSISKAIATTTGERVDTSKELIGQGLANIAGSFFGSYTVSGSFSRSAVAARTGAKTGLFAIISALAVVAVLLFFTEYLYHLPQAVLAVIVMMAVFSLIRVNPLLHAWKVDPIGASIGIITFFATLWMAPSIANGILLGVALTILHFLVQTMKPRADVLSRKADGTLGGMRTHQLTPLSEYFVPVRFDGSLTFVNVAYFEDMILEACAEFPQARTILVIGSSINEVDASGEEKIREVASRLREIGITLAFSGLKHQVLSILETSGLVDELGRDAFYADKETALQNLAHRYHSQGGETAINSGSLNMLNERLAVEPK